MTGNSEREYKVGDWVRILPGAVGTIGTANVDLLTEEEDYHVGQVVRVIKRVDIRPDKAMYYVRTPVYPEELLYWSREMEPLAQLPTEAELTFFQLFSVC